MLYRYVPWLSGEVFPVKVARLLDAEFNLLKMTKGRCVLGPPTAIGWWEFWGLQQHDRFLGQFLLKIHDIEEFQEVCGAP